MAKYMNSGLIPFIKGPIGDVVFTYWKGVPVIRRKLKKGRRGTPSLAQKRVHNALLMLSSDWKKLSFGEWALWEEYAKRYDKMKIKKVAGLCTNIGSKMTGCNAYNSVNLLLILSGFEPVEKPPLGGVGKPSLPSTDLIDCGLYQDEIKFNIWMSKPYPAECVVQVWLKKLLPATYSHIGQIVKVSDSRTQVTIDRIKTREGKSKRAIEKKFEEMQSCKLYLQLRTVAQNGEFSMPSQIYKLEVKSTNFRGHRNRQGIFKLFPKILHSSIFF